MIGGHLLVLQGDANVYGRLLGNLVTLNGDVNVYPGRGERTFSRSTGVLLAGRRDRRRGERSTCSASRPARGGGGALLLRRGSAGLAGVVRRSFITLALGFGLVLFAWPTPRSPTAAPGRAGRS